MNTTKKKVLLTGANGYIGQRLLPMLVDKGYHVIVFVRSVRRVEIPSVCQKSVTLVVGDLLDIDTCSELPTDIEFAYYLVHSLSHDYEHLVVNEKRCALNFLKLMKPTKVKQIIYLGGLHTDEALSPHLQARKMTEDTLSIGDIPVTTLRAGIIIGSGSASFEIIRDLVEKLPIMIAPKWVNNKCQPIGIVDVLEYLIFVLGEKKCFAKSFDIGGPDVLSYKDILRKFAEKRGLSRLIIGVPFLTPRLSSYWLYLVTSANYQVASALVESLKNNTICRENSIHSIIPKTNFPFEIALQRTFEKIEDGIIFSSWKDSMVMSDLNPNLLEYVKVPTDGCFKDYKHIDFSNDVDAVTKSVWMIGGKNGWYYMNWAWVIRGWLDRIIGGTGLRRGRTHPHRLRNGDTLDFWRVLLADTKNRRLLLYAEMKVPGEAWLEFEIIPNANGVGGTLKQTATFRPHGIFGRLYWYALFPFHLFIFKGLANAIVRRAVT